MDYESFKEKFVEDLKDRLDEQGADVKVSVNTVNKLNESYVDPCDRDHYISLDDYFAYGWVATF